MCAVGDAIESLMILGVILNCGCYQNYYTRIFHLCHVYLHMNINR